MNTSALKQKFNDILLKIRHKLFVFRRKWHCHPLFGRFYPKKTIYRRLLALILAILVLLPTVLFFLRPSATDAAWYNDSWRFRKKIAINHTKVPSTQTNFPVLVSITDSSLSQYARSDGYDIVFTTSAGSGTKLSHEIEFYTASTGKLVAWVKIPSLSSSTDTILYMYYGNSSSTNQQDKANVWSNGYRGVWHLGESSGSAADSTSYGTNGTVTEQSVKDSLVRSAMPHPSLV